MNKKGSTIVIVLALVAIFSTMGIMLLTSNSQTDKERKFYMDYTQVYYIGEAGITHAFHFLKGKTPDDIDFSEEIDGKLARGVYNIKFEQDSKDKNKINIICNAKIGKINTERNAQAIFKLEKEITLNTSYLCKEEIRKLWELKFIN
jgi:anti-anti-sigma regulatory factor